MNSQIVSALFVVIVVFTSTTAINGEKNFDKLLNEVSDNEIPSDEFYGESGKCLTTKKFENGFLIF